MSVFNTNITVLFKPTLHNAGEEKTLNCGTTVLFPSKLMCWGEKSE